MELNTLKPFLSVFVMPHTLGMLLVLAGLLRGRRWQRQGLALSLAGLLLLWLSACKGSALFLQDQVLRVPPALDAPALQRLRETVQAQGADQMAVVVLGGGVRSLAAEYGEAMLEDVAMARLHYGVVLARQLGAPLAYAGGLGWAQKASGPAVSEAAAAASATRRHYGVEIRWPEGRSRDTRENARNMVDMLQAAGVRQIVLVTHATHMPRSLRAFDEAAAGHLTVTAAPMSHLSEEDQAVLAWMPSGSGAANVHAAWHEVMGLLLGR